jgi:hypothetical protein
MRVHGDPLKSIGFHKLAKSRTRQSSPIFVHSDALAVILVDLSDTAICRLPRFGRGFESLRPLQVSECPKAAGNRAFAYRISQNRENSKRPIKGKVTARLQVRAGASVRMMRFSSTAMVALEADDVLQGGPPSPQTGRYSFYNDLQAIGPIRLTISERMSGDRTAGARTVALIDSIGFNEISFI